MYSMASFTRVIFSASSSGISIPNSSSNAMTSSTVSSESAPRSSTNDASGVTSSSSTPNCSTMMLFTLSATAIQLLRFVVGGWWWVVGNQLRPQQHRATNHQPLTTNQNHMYMPPFTASTCPVIYAASSEARKQTAAATSRGAPRRPRGMADAQSACALSVIALVMSVSMRPGVTTFTVMLRDATSRAIALLNPINPAFDAA